MPETQVKVLVLPVLRRYWLFHAWKEAPPQQTGVQKTWMETIQAKMTGSFEKQWHKLEAAPEGSFNHRLFRLAQSVMSRVDPSESFLKTLPQQAKAFEIMYPSSIPERLVRRRLRHLAAKAAPFHASRLRVWAAALVPQLPLIPLPLPNVTIYYTIWRIASNRSAGRGATSLSEALELHNNVQRLELAQQLQQLQQQQGIQLKPGSWAAQLLKEKDSLEQQVQQRLAAASGSSVEQQQQHRHQGPCLPLPVFIQDTQLERFVEPAERLVKPLPEEAVLKLMELYKQPHLLEHFRAANRKCLGDIDITSSSGGGTGGSSSSSSVGHS